MAGLFERASLFALLTLGCAGGAPHVDFAGNEIDLAAEEDSTSPPDPPPKWCAKGEAGCAMPEQEAATLSEESTEPLDPNKRYTVDVSADDPRKGPPTAPVTLVVFSDFQCPFCKKLALVLAELSMNYPQQVQVVWKDLPLVGHEFALPAALLGREAYEKGGSRRFWALHDVLFTRQSEFNSETLAEIAQRFELSWPPEESHQAHIDADFEQVLRLNVRSTPTVFINGRPIVGSQPLEEYERLIDEELSRQTARHRQSFWGPVPRQARSQRPPRENRRGGNLRVFEPPQASSPYSRGCVGPARLGPRSEAVAAAGIGGGGYTLRYQRWTAR